MVFTWNMHWHFGEQPTGDEVLSFGSRNSNGKDQVQYHGQMRNIAINLPELSALLRQTV